MTKLTFILLASVVAAGMVLGAPDSSYAASKGGAGPRATQASKSTGPVVRDHRTPSGYGWSGYKSRGPAPQGGVTVTRTDGGMRGKQPPTRVVVAPNANRGAGTIRDHRTNPPRTGGMRGK